jgi:hypothetical protein
MFLNLFDCVKQWFSAIKVVTGVGGVAATLATGTVNKVFTPVFAGVKAKVLNRSDIIH